MASFGVPVEPTAAVPTEEMKANTPVAVQAELVSPVEAQKDLPEQQKSSTSIFHQLQQPSNENQPSRTENSTSIIIPDEKQYPRELQILHGIDNQTSNDSSNNDEMEQKIDDDDYIDVSFWDILASCSMILLWFQRSTFGVVYLCRSILLGHFLRLFVANYVYAKKGSDDDNNDASADSRRANDANERSSINGAISDGIHKVLTLLYDLVSSRSNSSSSSHHYSYHSSSSSHKQMNSWPPPALVVLATLTIVALVVHPDGMTWIALSKIRDTMVSLLETSKTCWDSSVREYGIVKTASASASIFMVFIVVIVMHKAFFSNFRHCLLGGRSGKEHSAGGSLRQRRQGTAADKKRRRRKGHHGSKHQQHHNRIKGGSTGVGNSPLSCPRLPKVEEVSSDGATSDVGNNNGSALIPNLTFQDFDTAENPAEPSRLVESSYEDAPCDPNMISQEGEEEVGSTATSPSVLESVVSSDETEVKRRGSIPLVCTVDSMSDDVSCGSMSVRSGPPPRQQPKQQQQPVWSRGNTKPGKPSNNSLGKKAMNHKLTRGQKQTTNTGKTMQTSTFTRPDFGKTRPSGSTNSYNDTRHDASNRMGYGRKQTRGGKGRTGGNNQNSRGGRGKGGGRYQKTQKNTGNTSRTQSPLPSTGNNSFYATTPTRRDATAISAPSTTDSSSLTSNGNQSNRMHPGSPYSQSLFSCEVGNSGWSLPTLPLSKQNRESTSMQTTLAPACGEKTNSLSDPYSVSSADQSCGLWQTENRGNASAFSNSVQSTPQRPLRAPPGLPEPAAILTTPARSSKDDLYTPISTPSQGSSIAPAMIPVTPSFGSSIPGHNNTLPYSWSGIDNGNTTTIAGAGNTGEGGYRSTVKDNPFANNSTDDSEYRIEAELQELGGQMIGSVLDF